jgi:hypothetical protein
MSERTLQTAGKREIEAVVDDVVLELRLSGNLSPTPDRVTEMIRQSLHELGYIIIHSEIPRIVGLVTKQLQSRRRAN